MCTSKYRCSCIYSRGSQDKACEMRRELMHTRKTRPLPENLECTWQFANLELGAIDDVSLERGKATTRKWAPWEKRSQTWNKTESCKTIPSPPAALQLWYLKTWPYQIFLRSNVKFSGLLSPFEPWRWMFPVGRLLTFTVWEKLLSVQLDSPAKYGAQSDRMSCRSNRTQIGNAVWSWHPCLLSFI